MSLFLRNTTFSQLAALDAVARLESVSRAAHELNRTQPAVSIQIKLLEELAGAPLLQRSGRGIRLTETGGVLASYASRILALWREAGDEMETLSGAFAGALRVGAVTTAEYLLPPLLVTFANANPKVSVTLHVGNRDAIVRMLAGHEIDLAIMGRPPAELRTVSSTFAKHPMGFIAAPDHPLIRKRRLGLAGLAGEHMLVRERGSGTRANVERLFKQAGLTLRVGSELSSNEAIKQMTAAGFGIGFLSLHTCALELATGVVALLPLANNPIAREWYVMHAKGRQVPRVAAAFEEFLTARAQAEIDRHLGRY